MTTKEIVPRSKPREDVNAIVERDVSEDAEHAALGFLDALEEADAHIAHHPSTGSPRYAHELTLPGLRFWPLRAIRTCFSASKRGLHIDVWHVLHGLQDIPARMQVAGEI